MIGGATRKVTMPTGYNPITVPGTGSVLLGLLTSPDVGASSMCGPDLSTKPVASCRIGPHDSHVFSEAGPHRPNAHGLA